MSYIILSEIYTWAMRLSSLDCLPGRIQNSAPIVITTSISNLTLNSAQSGGDVTNDGGAPVTTHGICWSTSQNPTIVDKSYHDGTGTGSFTSSITGLAPNTTYYVRAYATNSSGTAYGPQVSFTTYKPDAITDIDGNYYNIVTIGSQVWLGENLKTTRYNDGTPIPNVTDNIAWASLTSPAYCWFRNDRTNFEKPMGLYITGIQSTLIICVQLTGTYLHRKTGQLYQNI